jgi:ribosomal protein S18 acetylase RimI-like enzyme
MKPTVKKLSHVTISKFRIEDYNALLSLWDQAQLAYKPKGRDRRDRVEREIEHPNAIFLTAKMGKTLVGSVLGTHDGRKGWINRLAVSPAFRKQGIASRLIAEVEKRLSKLGIEIVACLIENYNNESMKVFKRAGFKRHSDIIYFSKRKNSMI